MSTAAGTRPVIFVHVAKTAGTSLAEVLQAAVGAERLQVRTHRPVATLPTVDHARCVAVIREPVDRLVSAWHWLHRRPSVLWHGQVGNVDLVRELGLDRFADCRDFLDHFDTFYEDQVRPFAACLPACDRKLGDLMTFAHFNLFAPQQAYLCNLRGGLAVPHLLRFEHLVDDVADFLDQVAPGHDPVVWPHRYRSEREPAAACVTERALAAIREIYDDDYALPGMAPPPSPAVPAGPAGPAPSPASALTRAVLKVRTAVGCGLPSGAVEAASSLVALLADPAAASAADCGPLLPRDRPAPPDGARAALLAWAWEMRACLQDEAGDRAAATISLCRAVAADPDGWHALLRLAAWRLEQGDRAAALADLQRLKDLAAARPAPALLEALADLLARA